MSQIWKKPQTWVSFSHERPLSGVTLVLMLLASMASAETKRYVQFRLDKEPVLTGGGARHLSGKHFYFCSSMPAIF